MRHVVALSGGKDSTALALRLQELGMHDYEYICTPTGNEFPEVFDHLNRLEDMLGKPIKRLGIGLDLYELIEEQKMIPNFRARFCTTMLKIDPTIEYMRSLPEGSIMYVGLRADEETREGIYSEYVNSVYPFRMWSWGLEDVWGYLNERGVEIPARTDCAVCFYQRLIEWYDLWKHNPGEWAKAVAIEDKIGHTFRSPRRDTWPASLANLGKAFEERGEPTRSKRTNGCRVCTL